MKKTIIFLATSIILVIHTIAQKYEPINLGTNVNSEESEFAPFISADGKTLYFSSTNRITNIGGKEDYSDIYFSKIQEDGSFSKAENIGEPINSAEYGEIVISVTPDGNTMLLSRNNSKQLLFVSKRTIESWSEPKPISIQDLPLIKEILFNFGSDGRTLLLGFQGETGFGYLDLWVSFMLNDSTFSKPMNLGNVINTSNLEYSPFLSPDMKTLYFSSNRQGGQGGRDIFKSTRLDDTWKNWSNPENLGSTINTAEEEYYYCVSSIGDYAYVATSYKSYGYLDIYKIDLPQMAKPKPVVLVSGKVINSKDSKYVEASITYENLITGEKMGIARSNPDDGNYLIVLPAGQSYGYLAEAPDFYSISENIDLTNITENDKLHKDLMLMPIEIGSEIKLNNIFFDFNQFVLKDESFSELSRLIDLLKEYKTMEIEINGHTDNVGTQEYNMQLSKNRANAVKDYLIKNGISAERIVSKGYGSTKPIEQNSTEFGKQQNRRVQFIIKKK